MYDSLMMLVPVLVLLIVTAMPIIGCVGKDPEVAYQEGKEEGKKEQAEAEAKEKEAEKQKEEAAKYDKAVVAEPDLISYWRLSEGETGDVKAKDSAPDMPKDGEYKNAGAGGIARDVPGALAVLAIPGDKAAEFDGVKGFVEVPHDALINPALEFTVEAWVRPAELPLQPQVILGSYEVNPTGDVIRGVVLDIFADAGGYRLRARVGNGTGNTAIEASLESGLEHDGWRHVAVTYSVATKTLKLYVNSDNGVPDAVLPAAAPAPQTPVFYVANQSSPLRIAAGQVELPAPLPSPGQFFKGRIDEVALYRVPLDGSKVRDHFLRGIALPS